MPCSLEGESWEAHDDVLPLFKLTADDDGVITYSLGLSI